MSFEDGIGLVIFAFLAIISFSVMAFLWAVAQPVIPSTNVSTQMGAVVTNTASFWDNSLPTIYIILWIISIVFVVLLNSNPLFMIIFVIINIAGLLAYDTILDVLNAFLATPMYLGTMPNSVAFFSSGIPKLTVIGNLLMAVFLFGKRGLIG